jgi:hypothetical protein
MLTEIEEKIVDRLKLKITEPKHVDIDEAHSALAVPSIDVVVGGGGFTKVSSHYKLTANVFVIVTFQNLRSVKDRRKGVYPLVESIVALLVGNSLGLKITPIIPKRLDNITEKDEAEEGKIVFQLEFETGFVIEKLTDEEITDLIAVGLNYYLTPDDGTADASDMVTLSGS